MDIFFEFAPYFCIAAVAFYIGKYWALFQFSNNLSKDPDRMIRLLNQIKAINNSEDDGMPEGATQLHLEQVNEQIYAYDHVTGEFLAQGPNEHLASQAAAARYPEKTFWYPAPNTEHRANS